MKNWRFVKTGNKDTPELREKLRDLNEQIKNWEHAKGIDGVEKANAHKTLDELRKERSEVQKEIATDNESIDKQEWSMFKGLTKDAEKEVGNAWTSADERRFDELNKKGPSKMTDAEWKEFQELNKRAYQADRKALKSIGNADTVSEYNAEIQRLTKKAEQLRRMGQGKSAMEIEKQIEKLGKELRELGNKKAGNAQYGSKEDIISHLDTDLYEIHQRLKQKDESPWRYLSELQKKGYDMGTLSRHNKDIGKIIEKLKTGNETKAEEKFGKVMGEYEEGALKTPQGKTVTDPAQAKAIAYSEADKVDNLKRARNAMNKKVGNLDHVEEGDYVSVRYQGEIVDGVVRKIQGTQALVTIDGTDMWFPIRSLKEST